MLEENIFVNCDLCSCEVHSSRAIEYNKLVLCGICYFDETEED